MIWRISTIVMFVLLHEEINTLKEGSDRKRRYLVYPSGSQYGTYATISIPLNPTSTTTVGWFYEAQYNAVANVTYFEPLLGDIDTISRSRDERSASIESGEGLTRRIAYILLENLLEKHGYPGRACLLRAICEGGTSHFLHNGLLGDLLHFLLTPSTSMAEDDIEYCFYEAELKGLYNVCDNYFKNCPKDPFDHISINFEDIVSIQR